MRRLGTSFEKGAWLLGQPTSLRGKLFQKLLRDSRHISLPTLININAIERPHYAYCMYYAALLAQRLDIHEVSALEFGVAGGNGLLAMEKLATRITKETGVCMQLYGFDTGEGLPILRSRFDLPYWFKPGHYRLEPDKLLARLKTAQLVLGDIKDTAETFFSAYSPAPIGCIFHDFDYYTSTSDSLKILDGDDKYFLPRCFFYFDDVVGGPWEMYGEENGELRAIRDFNRSNENRKITKNANLTARSYYTWHHQIYYYHNFSHPLYDRYIGGVEQDRIESSLSLSQP